MNIPFPLGVDANGASLLYDTIAAFGAYSVVKVNQETGQQEVTDVPDHATNVYAFNQPGLYTVQLRYKFTGLASLNSLTFQLTGLPYWKGWPVYNPYFDTIDSNEATFRIQ